MQIIWETVLRTVIIYLKIFLWEMGMYRYSQKCSVISLLLSPYPQIPSDAHQALYS